MIGHFLFYLKYYLTNHVINKIPFHVFRLFWYRKILKIQIGIGSHLFLGQNFYGNAIQHIKIGDHSILNPNCLLNASDSIEIGNQVVLAHHVSLHTADHDIHSENFPMQTAPICIQDGAWIASHAIILKGVTIGKGAVVGAGAVVTHSVGDYEVVVGNPAKVIAHRKIKEIQISKSKPPLFC